MIRTLALSLVCLVLACFAAACSRSVEKTAPAPAAEGLVVTNPSGARPFFHDFGSVQYGDKPRHVFVLENREGRPIKVNSLTPSCSCTVGSIAYTDATGRVIKGSREKGVDVITIPAGASAEVTFELDTRLVERMNMDKLAVARMITDSDRTPFLAFEMHLIVLRTFRSVPPKVDLGETPQSYGAAKRADVSVELPGNTSRIRAVESVVGPFEAQIAETQVGAETLWIVTIQAPAGLPFGPHQGKVALSTIQPDGSDGFPFEIEVSAQVVSDVVAHPSTLEFGRVDRAAGAQRTAQLVSLAPGTQVAVRAHRFEGQGAELLAAQITPLDEQDSPRAQRWSIAVTLPPTAEPTRFHGQLVIETDDAGTPVVRLPFSGETH